MGSIDSKAAQACSSADVSVGNKDNNNYGEEDDDASTVVVTHSGLRLRHLDGNNYLGRLQDAPGFSGGGGGGKSGAAVAAAAAAAALVSSRLFRRRRHAGGDGCDCCCGCRDNRSGTAAAITAARTGGGGSSASSCRTSVSSGGGGCGGGGSRFSSAQESPLSPSMTPNYAWLGGRGCCYNNYTGLQQQQQQQHRYDNRQESQYQHRHANLSTLLARGFDPAEYERRAVETAAAARKQRSLREAGGRRAARTPGMAPPPAVETAFASKVMPETAQ